MFYYIAVALMLTYQLLSASVSFEDGSVEMSKMAICETPQNITIAVTTVDMTNKTAKLVFSSEGIQNQLSIALKQSNCFRVVDWNHLSDVIARHQLEWSDIVNNGESRRKLQKILAVDYFLLSSINSYSSDTEYANSAFSKEKKQNVSIGIDMILKNALTNEYITTVSTQGFASKVVEQSLGFGAGANSSEKVSNLALERAIEDGIKNLTKQSLKRVALTSDGEDEGIVNDIDIGNISKSMEALVAQSSSDHCPGKWVTASGYSTMEKGMYQAKKRATMDAYRTAVSIGSGVKIDSFSRLSMSESMSNAYSVISKKSNGFITYYDILDTTRKANDYEVKIKACVAQSDVSGGDVRQGLEQFLAMIGSPSVLIVLGQEKMDSDSPRDRVQLRTVETSMAEFFSKLGYSVTTSDDLIGRGLAKEEQIINARSGRGGDAIELARSAGVDILISGNIVFSQQMQQLSDAKGNIASASFNAKAIMPGSGKIVGIYNKQSKMLNLTEDTLSGRETIIKRTALQMANGMAWDIPAYLLSEERDIQIVIRGVGYNTFRTLLKKLKSEPEVVNIREGGRWRRTQGELGNTWIVITTSFFGITIDEILDRLSSYGLNPQLDIVSDYYAEIAIGK
ncbi:MAG: hypothetical protein JXK05_08160 [Campylobacterales bacterium]|nr:hypothetical protein [Campylobacterales bacterium]